MKKVLVLLSLLLMFSFGFANPWSVRNDGWQTWAATSIEVDQTVTFAVTWGEGGWDAFGSNVGYGTSSDGTDWTWTAIDWVEDDGPTNKKCSTTVTFDTPGTYYYVFRMTKGSVDYYGSGHNGWEETSMTITDKISTEFFKVTVTEGEVPITLSSFTAVALKGKVKLDWVTESETENSHFLVYRDGEVIGHVDGAGTTTEQHSYTFLDTRVRGGIHSYAIADVTYGGVEELHDAVTVEVGAEIAEADFVLNKAYPNPFNPRVALSMEYGVGSNSVVNIYTTQGVLVDQLINGFVEAGHHEVVWDASNMTSGVYIVKMIVGDVMQSQKIVLMK